MRRNKVDGLGIAFVLWFVFCLAISIGMIVVLIHFITKWW